MTVQLMSRVTLVAGAALLAACRRTDSPAKAARGDSAPAVPTARAAVANCGLRGDWAATLMRGRREVRGTIAIADSAGPRAPSGIPYRTLPTWRGRYAVSTVPLFAAGEGRVESTSRSAPSGGESVNPVYAVLSLDDSVALTFEPHVSHGPLSLVGVLRGDTITGRWAERTGAPAPPGQPDPTPRGAFTLVRAAGCRAP